MRLWAPLLPLALSLMTVPVLAGQGPPAGCKTPEFREFDFWVGEWAVTDSAGAASYGANSVTNEEGGCLVHEHWTGTKGGSGQSFNFYDARLGKWEQVWVGSGGGMLTLVGRFDAGAMVLEGESGTGSGKALNRVRWTAEPDGRVRQYWTVSTDGGKSWSVSFDGWYRRKN